MSAASYFFRNARDRAAGADRAERSAAKPGVDPTLEQLLAFEAANPKRGERKNERILDQLGITAPRYFQLLGRHIWSEEALQADPVTTNRLRRMSRDREIERARRTTRN